MDKFGIEYRRGSAGGGNQTRQPYIKEMFPNGVQEALKTSTETLGEAK